MSSMSDSGMNGEWSGFPSSPFFQSVNKNNYTLDPRDPLYTQYSYVNNLTNQAVFPNASYGSLAAHNENTSIYTACPGLTSSCISSGIMKGEVGPPDETNSCGCIYATTTDMPGSGLENALQACLYLTTTAGEYNYDNPITCLGVLEIELPSGYFDGGSGVGPPYYQPFSMNPVYTNTSLGSGTTYLINSGYINAQSTGTYPTSAQVMAAQMAANNYAYIVSELALGGDAAIPPCNSTAAYSNSCNIVPSDASGTANFNTTLADFQTAAGATNSKITQSAYYFPMTYCAPGLTPFNMIGFADVSSNNVGTYGTYTCDVSSNGYISSSSPYNGSSWDYSNGELTWNTDACIGTTQIYYTPNAPPPISDVSGSGTGLPGYWSAPQTAFGCACPPPYNWDGANGCIEPSGLTSTNVCPILEWGEYMSTDNSCCTSQTSTTGSGAIYSGLLTYSLNDSTTPGGYWTCGCSTQNPTGANLASCTNLTGQSQCGCNANQALGCLPSGICSPPFVLDPNSCSCTCPEGQNPYALSNGSGWGCMPIPCPTGYIMVNGICVSNNATATF